MEPVAAAVPRTPSTAQENPDARVAPCGDESSSCDPVPAMMRRPMGSLEGAVLDVLWSTEEALKPGEVLDRLDLDPPVTYATVLTILRRLWKKDLVDREKDGKAFRYRPVRSRDEEVARTMADAFTGATDPDAALGHFVDNLSRRHANALERLLRKGR